jgi:MFS family permease
MNLSLLQVVCAFIFVCFSDCDSSTVLGFVPVSSSSMATTEHSWHGHHRSESHTSPTTLLPLLPHQSKIVRGVSLSIESTVKSHGGGGDDDDASPLAEHTRTIEKRRQRGMGWALAATYFTVMAAKCALPSVLSMLVSSSTGLTFPSDNHRTPQNYMAFLLLLSTLAVASGKLLLGPVIDTAGGILSLKVALYLLSALLALISTSQSFWVFATSWVMVDFIFSSCWASCINAIHQSFPEDQWATRIGHLAAAARTGNAAAFALFASLLQKVEKTVSQPWRPVFAIAAVLQVVPILLLTFFGKPPPKTSLSDEDETHAPRESKATLRKPLQILKREVQTLEFWLHLVSRSCLMLFASFLLFVPTLVSNVYGASSAVAAQSGSVFAIGCLISVTAGSSWYARQSTRVRAISLAVLLFLSTLSSAAHLAHVTGIVHLSLHAVFASLFLWGFSFAIPFYCK